MDGERLLELADVSGEATARDRLNPAFFQGIAVVNRASRSLDGLHQCLRADCALSPQRNTRWNPNLTSSASKNGQDLVSCHVSPL